MVAVDLPESTRPAARRSPAARGRRAAGRILPLVPAFALIALFFLGPILWCVYASFTDVALTGATASTPHLIGLRNYRRMFADPAFGQSLWLTVVFVVGSAVIGQNVGGMALALLMKSRHRIARAVVGAIVVGAWVMPELVAGFVWYAFLADDGTLNAILRAVGLHGKSWLYVMPLLSVIIANVWRGTAFSMLVYSAALSNVPEDLLEAAAVDGASAYRRLRHITLPLMRRAVMTNLMTITLQTLAVFTLIFVMTGGGPGTKTQTLPIYMYQSAFKFYQLGYGAALAIVLLAVGGVFSVIYLRMMREEI
ncbi:carbohydrate ABC transporter permease [Actinoallomurus iriomotensis]|uniref:Amino acid ABC transporter permease n=1 Tax=Actinoallomurus iriomotensis TaxID=478107 RepID=A0A9W6RHD1_9ACTN|nr:sugar ABC transporter permease [Actinoallomurus iriomotensis]GLY76096.1 amino acid ABC transporter permease [Actinoallomurus iriomotensis]